MERVWASRLRWRTTGATQWPAFVLFTVIDGVRRARAYVRQNAPPEYRNRVDEATSLVFGNDLLRTCVPGDDPDRWWCVFVFTDQDPPGLRQDSNRAPNSSYLPAERG